MDTTYQMRQLEHFLWTEKYRPTKIEDCILPQHIKTVFEQFVEKGDFPHLLLAGSAGCGKTTIAKALTDQLGLDVYFFNASETAGIDAIRNQLRDFCSNMSLTDAKKCVILDEADNATPAFFSAFRGFLEEFSKNVRFILTCNYMNKIIEPIHSRCSVIEFKISKEDRPELMKQFMKRIKFILRTEEIDVESFQVIGELVFKHFPDYRRMINELQQYSAKGKIDSGLLLNQNHQNEFKELIKYLKEKDFKNMLAWCSRYCNGQNLELFRKFYDSAKEYFTDESIPGLILLISKYQYQAGFVMDGEINFASFCTEVMAELELKS
jgi:DNA polymerase III delta prime subunit